MQNIRLGLRENLKQFATLVDINGFVGRMLVLERTILPHIAEKKFSVAAKTALLAFFIVFGVVKAITNYYTDRLAKFGRKNLLIAGSVFVLTIPFS